MLDTVPKPSAVFAYNDSQAVGLMLRLQEAGIDVPKTLSIAGFDGIELGTLVRPSLTTVAQPIQEIGERGARMLIDIIQERAEGASIVLPPALVTRSSVVARSVTARAMRFGEACKIHLTPDIVLPWEHLRHSPISRL